ncbi:ABC transporter permease [Paenibacillus sp. P96]|uniref:ABC transporter permease n=1 Tax=Paenibacillus zeirhizosphaerae TaxID=2987519 RepID=A0ABT9FW68_9BACL|nr:ABC transporter permease [Paenibacillus sp. P96]MDP4098940.1 ABC transporter permease [Paenibacillus sp. P96]
MADFFKLVHNENLKIYIRIRTWVMLVILAFISAIVPVLIYLASDEVSAWDGMLLSASVSFFLNIIFTVVVAADSIAGEFSAGTIKLLLIRPWSRSKLLISKYLSVVLFSLVGTVLLIVMGSIFSLLFLRGTGGITEMLPGWSVEGYTTANLLSRYADLFIICTFAFMLSAVFRSGGLTIGLSLFILFMQNTLSLFFTPERYGWAKYALFNNMGLSQYMLSPIGPGGMTLGFSISVLAVYYVLFIAICWIVFVKRDVTA